jgi:PilZ domain
MPKQMIAMEERRLFRRIPCKLKVQSRLVRVTEEGVWLATIRNISLEGIGLMVNRCTQRGMFLTVEIPSRPPLMRKPALVHVVHARAHPGGQWWNVGGQFVHKLTKDELDVLRARQPAINPPVERRTSARFTTKFNTAFPLIRVTEEGPWWVSVRDVSLRGVSLIVNRPFRTGSYATLELPTKAGGLGQSRLMCIKHIHVQPGNHWWVIGGQFVNKLTREELLDMMG